MFYITLGIGCATIGIVYLLMTKKKKQSFKLTVVIVGASSGIGEACAEAFYRSGSRLVLCARRLSELERVKQKLLRIDRDETANNKEDQIQIRRLDITDSQATKQVLSDTNPDILVNNAGVSYRGSIEDTEVKVQRDVMEVNYFGQVEATKAILPSMIQRGSGHIVFISSLQGKLSIPYRSAYSASKHAIQAFADCLRAEMCQKGIKVTVISPAYVHTDLSINALHGDGSKHGVMDENQKKGMSTEEVAARVLVAIDNHESEVLLCSMTYKVVVLLRNVFPGLFFKLMQWRANKKEG